MKLRAPSIPLITVDPFFSVWSPFEKLNFKKTKHWTGKDQSITARVTVDGITENFLGYNPIFKKMNQTEMDIDALSTRYTFDNDKIKLLVKFTTPALLDDLSILTRPVSYMEVSYESKDGRSHDVDLTVQAYEEICLNNPRQSPISLEKINTRRSSGFKMGNTVQDVLNRSGDDHRIDWGYFYLTANNLNTEASFNEHYAEISFKIEESKTALVLFAYDDIRSINYFGKQLTSYWNKDGQNITDIIDSAIAEYNDLSKKCDDFSDALYAEAYMAGGEKYADLLSLAYRQIIAAHKVAVDTNGDILYISKECFSNGCAATVDVSYPSTPIFLRYNTELVKGMLRPIYKFASTDAWKYDFAPHDAGKYPLVTGQVYGLDALTGELRHSRQMPVEECGNMIIMEANIALADGNAEFAKQHIDTLKGWCEYLIKYGDDPENQLCTDDFAGHLAHNCNLTLKAVMGIMGMSIICDMLGDINASAEYKKIAKEKADSWIKRARNNDGSFRLTFDKEGTFSMKYNMVWDKIWGTRLFPTEVYEAEIKSNLTKINEYGMPLDSRSDYTKSDWLVWTATLASSKSDFKRFVSPLWKFYNDTPDRVPMTDWYDTISCMMVGFVHRTVQGGLFIKMLDESKKLKYTK